MTLSETPFAALDFESAGAQRGSTDVPVQIGVASLDRLDAPGIGTFTSYLASDQPIVWSAQKVHGIRNADLEGAPTLLELWPQLNDLLQGRWIIAHGAATEKRFLRAFPFHGFGPWVDTLKLARALWPTLPSHALGDLILALGLEEEMRAAQANFRWHDALSDAIASVVLLRHLVKTAGLEKEEPAVLLRADDSIYHRDKAARRGR